MLQDIQSIFIVGIKGAGMANLAVILQQMGKQVTGWDVPEVFPTDHLLSEHNISFSTDHKLALPSHTQLVIYSAAHKGKHNGFVMQATSQNILVKHQAEVIGELMKEYKYPVAVCGCHGKTTTSSMLAYALMKLNTEVSYIIGTPGFNGYPGSQYKGTGYIVVEADEYAIDPPEDKTPKLMCLHPAYIINTNIDFDHPDVYKDIDETREAFKRFFTQIPSGKTLILNADDPQTRLILPELSRDSYLTYGVSDGSDLQIKHITESATGLSMNLAYNGKELGSVQLDTFGDKNALNAAGVVLFLLTQNFSIDQIQSSLRGFTGSKRRLEHLATRRGVELYDDYAHHPAEIQASIQALRAHYPDHRVIVIFQPHTFSRTEALASAFVEALALADHAYIMPIFGSAREQIAGHEKNEHMLVSLAQTKNYNTIEAYTPELASQIKEGDIVCLMGAGDVYKLADTILPK